jgi:hypothetical protein
MRLAIKMNKTRAFKNVAKKNCFQCNLQFIVPSKKKLAVYCALVSISWQLAGGAFIGVQAYSVFNAKK